MKVRLPWITLAGAATALVLAMSPPLSAALQMDRTALAQGEYWRLLTGHFTHWTADHFAWDVVVFGVCGTIVELESRRRMLATLLGSALAVSVAVVVFLPELTRYRGLSGVDSALFAAALLALLARVEATRSPLARVLVVGAGIGLAVKTIAEWVAGHAFFVAPSPDFVSVPLAHLVGATLGICVAIPCFRTNRRRGAGVERDQQDASALPDVSGKATTAVLAAVDAARPTSDH